MTDRLNTAAAWLACKLKTEASTPCVLRRSNGTEYELNATRGQSVFEGQSYDDGSNVRIESQDFIVDVAELTGGYRPRAGDTITVTETAAVFEVFAPDGDHCFRNSSAHAKTIRIHSKEINAE